METGEIGMDEPRQYASKADYVSVTAFYERDPYQVSPASFGSILSEGK